MFWQDVEFERLLLFFSQKQFAVNPHSINLILEWAFQNPKTPDCSLDYDHKIIGVPWTISGSIENLGPASSSYSTARLGLMRHPDQLKPNSLPILWLLSRVIGRFVGVIGRFVGHHVYLDPGLMGIIGSLHDHRSSGRTRKIGVTASFGWQECTELCLPISWSSLWHRWWVNASFVRANASFVRVNARFVRLHRSLDAGCMGFTGCYHQHHSLSRASGAQVCVSMKTSWVLMLQGSNSLPIFCVVILDVNSVYF